MSFLVTCPNCGPRSVYEFRWGGEARPRPQAAAVTSEWREYVHVRRNTDGEAVEWWFHTGGCKAWFQADRNVTLNAIRASARPEEVPGRASQGPELPETPAASPEP